MSAASARGRHAAGADAAPAAKRPWWVEVGAFALITILLAFLIKTFLVGVYYIPSGSMENTLLIGDRVVVDKLSYRLGDIHRGDVIVFNGDDSFTSEGEVAPLPSNPVARAFRAAGGLVGLAPPNEKDFIKRVVGLPGDRVQCCDAQGRVTVNGVPLDEADYLYPGDAPSSSRFDVIVPEGKLWVLGDHRGASADSRAHQGDPGGGFVPEERVIGRARAVIWPFSRVGGLGTPDTFSAVTAPAGS